MTDDLTSAPPTGAEILADAEHISGAAQDTDECIAVADIEPLSRIYEQVLVNLLVSSAS